AMPEMADGEKTGATASHCRNTSREIAFWLEVSVALPHIRVTDTSKWMPMRPHHRVWSALRRRRSVKTLTRAAACTNARKLNLRADPIIATGGEAFGVASERPGLS